MNVVVTGARGFVGKNLCAALAQRDGVAVHLHDVGDAREALRVALRDAEVVFHLAGVNRPERVDDFVEGNAGFTREVLALLQLPGRSAKVVLTSSVQVERDNAYGRSKLQAEEALRAYCDATEREGVVYRLKNLFGKWCRPNYNSVTATFCHNVANDLPIQISDPKAIVDLTYVDDVVAAFLAELDAPRRPGFRLADPLPSRAVTLGELADAIRSFRAQRKTLVLPDFADPFQRALYATYLSYLPAGSFGYGLDIRTDARGRLAEFVKSPHLGQIFVSRTKPGITRGNHFHQTKVEKFLVVEGEGIVRFRQIHGADVQEYRVRGDEFRVIDIPPGYTHSIENVGSGEMVTIFWSSEIFDAARTDTIAAPVMTL